jgi:PAS domain S-box-containing protein
VFSADLEKFLELSPDLCCVVTFDGIIATSNEAWHVLGFAARELEGRPFVDLLHPDDRSAAEIELGRDARSSFTARFGGKDGVYRRVRWRSVAMPDTRRIYVLGRPEPTTVTRTERLMTLGQVAVGVVHDLKNVLVQPLSLNLQRIERALDVKDRDRAQAAITAMRDALRDGLETIDRMQQFARPSAQHKLARVELENVVWRATEIARAYAQSMKQPREIDIAYEPGKAKRIDADAFELLACLVNVMFNAIDAVTELGGKVDIRTGHAKPHAWIEIVDNGPGMTDEVRARIFEPFFTTKPDGIGIGLAVVKSCVERHRGTIQITSAPGAGTTFRIELPSP